MQSPRSRGRPPGRFTQHRRLDALRSLLLQRPRGMTLQQVAEALSVTTRSARRYMREVEREFELEKEPTQERAPLWRLRADERPRKVGLRRNQAYALLAARHLFEPIRGSALFEEIDLALKGLTALANRPGRGPNAGVADANLEERFLYLPQVPADYRSKAEELDVLYHGVADLRPVRCRYGDGGSNKDSRVIIHPYAMVLHKESVYAVGKELDSGQIQTFALHKIHDAELSPSEHFTVPIDFDVKEHVGGPFGMSAANRRTRVVIDFHPRVATEIRARRFHSNQRLSSLRGGGVRLVVNVADTSELTSWVLGFGSAARVVEPPSLREHVMAELKATLSLYRERKRAPK